MRKILLILVLLSIFCCAGLSAQVKVGNAVFQSAVSLTAGQQPLAVKIADIDGDGMPDIVVANGIGSAISVYLNQSPNGSSNIPNFIRTDIVLRAGTGAEGLIVQDLDGDGLPDIAVTCYGKDSIWVLRNISGNNQVLFAPAKGYFVGTGAHSIAAGDIDGDQHPDIVVSNFEAGIITLLQNISPSPGIINFQTTGYLQPGGKITSIKLADLNGDNHPELIAVIPDRGIITAYLNVATIGTLNTSSFGTRTNLTANNSAFILETGNLDNDPQPEIVVTNSVEGSVSIYKNNSTGTSLSFATKIDISVGSSPNGLVISDLDNDGLADIAVTNFLSSGTISVLHHKANGTFTSLANAFDLPVSLSAGAGPQSVTSADLNGDGSKELVAANSGGSTISVFNNSSVAAPVNTALAKILDSLSTPATAAYSVRQLKAVYSHSRTITPPAPIAGFTASTMPFTNSTTPLMRVRRSADSAMLDIGYDQYGYLDTATLRKFVKNGSGYIAVWYDQSGNNNDAYQTTLAMQPCIVNGGAVNMDGGYPALVFDGPDYNIQSLTTPVMIDNRSLLPKVTINMVYRQITFSDHTQVLWGGGSWNDEGRRQLLSAGSFLFSAGYYEYPQNILNNYGKIVYTAVMQNDTLNGSVVYANGASGTAFQENGGSFNNNLQIGGLGDGLAVSHMKNQEFIMFASALDNVNRQLLENNQITTYSAVLPPVIASIFPASGQGKRIKNLTL